MKKAAFDRMRMQAWISARLACDGDITRDATEFADQIVEEFETRFAAEVEPETFNAVSGPGPRPRVAASKPK
jgi:hypothetical protein